MNALRPDSLPARREGFERRIVLAFVALAHVALVVVLLSRTGVIPPERIPQVLQISLLTAPEPVHPPLPLPLPSPPPQRPAVVPHSVPAPPAPLAALAAPAAVAVPADVVAPVEPTPAAAPAPPAPPVVMPPRVDADYLDNPAPAYPPMSRRIGEEGTVLLHVFVEPDGTPGKVEIHRSSGSPRLDEAAAATVARWRFIPARQDNEAVAASVIVPITFKLDS